MGKMGISRDSRHKHRLTGGRMPIHKKKRKFESGRPAANTKLGPKKVRPVRTRGGHSKFRALANDHGNFNWSSQGVTRKTTVINSVYNATNNELVRTNTLVKNSIILIDATPFNNWLNEHYFGIHGDALKEAKVNFDWETSGESKDKFLQRRLSNKVPVAIQKQLAKGSISPASPADQDRAEESTVTSSRDTSSTSTRRR